MKKLFYLGAVLVLIPALAGAQYYPGKITDYTIGRPAEEKAAVRATRMQSDAAARMSAESAAPVEVKYNAKTGVPCLLSGSFSLGGLKAGAAEEAAVKAFLDRNRDIFGIRDASSELNLAGAETDQHGLRTLRFAQRHDGVPVYGGDLLAHLDAEGDLTSVNGNYLPGISVDTAPSVTSAEAVGIAKSALGIADADLRNTLGPELMVYPKDEAYHLAWCLTLVASKPAGEWKCFVDAKSGTLIEKWNDAKYADVLLTGKGVLGETLTVHGYYQNWQAVYWLDWAPWPYSPPWWDQTGAYILPGYGLVDTTKAMFNPSLEKGYIGTVNVGGQDVTLHKALNQPAYVCARYTTNFAGLFSGLYSTWDFSGHYNAGKVYDYWKNHFNRNSINNAGMTINVNVNCMFGSDATNAMWSKNPDGWWPDGAVYFGSGDGTTALGQSGSLSCVTHELTHGVTNYTCNLEYKNQSGAINEGFSDSFSYALRASAGDPNAHLYNGEGCWLASPGYLRNLQNPHLGYNPEPYSFGAMPANMDEYVTTDQDNGGVHINMSIISHTFYLNCQSIGVQKGEQVWYRTQTHYCTTTTDFGQLREYAVNAASDLYGKGAEYAAVANAFASVGIGNMMVVRGNTLTINVSVSAIAETSFGYNAYSVVTTPWGQVFTVYQSAVSPFGGALAYVPGLPNGYPASIYNAAVPTTIPAGDYVFEVAVIPAEMPQARENAKFHKTITVTML